MPGTKMSMERLEELSKKPGEIGRKARLILRGQKKKMGMTGGYPASGDSLPAWQAKAMMGGK